ncbi:peptide chain release factor 1 [bacterium]|nr:peptide chain release factor 1 [bacterium]
MALSDLVRDVLNRCLAVESQLADPKVTADPARRAALGKEFSRLEPLVQSIHKSERLKKEVADLKILAEQDREMGEMAAAELAEKTQAIARLEQSLMVELLPKDPTDAKNVILEIRAGTGGEEAALFAADLYRMYTRYADRRGWKTEAMSLSSTGIGGMKEAILSVAGQDVYSVLKHESGVHRVQRVPVTESSGRIHTSAASVAVLPEAEEVDVKIRDEDLRIDVFRSGGHGGQSVNTTDSAVRITHMPSGLVVSCQDEKSQLKNKARGMKVLRARLYNMEREKAAAERAASRREQVGTGDRSERIRTYNFPQNRVTDHRVNVTLHALNDVLEGNLDGLIGPLTEAEIRAKMEPGRPAA